MVEIETGDITERLVGITPLYLNNFLQRKTYGLTASIQPGEVRATRRLFSEEDVYGIALAWMLFECGLRTQAIRRILKKLRGTTMANANKTAALLLQSQAEYIVVMREPRRPKGATEPEVTVKTATKTELTDLVTSSPSANVLIVPIKAKFDDITKRLQILF
jgi:hypothetical protein